MAHTCPALGLAGPWGCFAPRAAAVQPRVEAGTGPSVKAVTTGQAQILKAEQIHKALTASEHLSIASSLLMASGAAAETDSFILSPKQPGGQVLSWNLSALQLLGCSEKCEVMAALVSPARPAPQGTQRARGALQARLGPARPGLGGRCHPGCHSLSPLEMSCLG